ncbi:hypothetical protein ACHQM5_026459 [Ranunculus cassubicifolius]
MADLSSLPEDCISHILSFTSPKDVCRSCVISHAFHAPAASNIVWKTFLSSDYEELLQKSTSPLSFSSMKELYFKLVIPFLVADGKMSFCLERSSGKKCYMLGAKGLEITWGSNGLYWAWKHVAHSRFEEAAELRTTYWLEIHGKIDTVLLSPQTTYAAYLVFRIEDRAYGLDTLPSETSVEVGNRRCKSTCYLRRCPDNVTRPLERHLYFDRKDTLKSRPVRVEEQETCDRNDGWLELELGEFFNHGGGGEVKMSLMEVKGSHLKGGLVIEGIELRPKE